MERPKSATSAGNRPASQGSQVEWYLSRAGLRPPPKIPILAKPPSREFQGELSSNRDAARSLLSEQRPSDPDFKAPWQQKRHMFRTKKQKEAVSSGENWEFTKHTVAKALDALLSNKQLPPVGVAHALLSHTALSSLDELWRHLNDAGLEGAIASSAASRPLPQMNWLDTATSHLNTDYIHLLCRTGVRQVELDRAFGIALSRSSFGAMKLLLSFGATASSYQDSIAERLRQGNLALLELLLSAPDSLGTTAWMEFLMREGAAGSVLDKTISLDVFLMCVANRRELACQSLLMAVLESQNLEATAVVLAYINIDEQSFMGTHQRIWESVGRVQSAELRLSFFTLLAASGLVVNGHVTREELFESVKASRMPIAKLLIESGVAVDTPPHNALQYAVSRMDFSTLELLSTAVFSSPVSHALLYVPDSASESDIVRLVGILGPLGISGPPLSLGLLQAVQKKQLRLIRMFLRCGASVEFEDAAVIRTALEVTDLDMLNILLRQKCSPKILSGTIRTAMAVKPRSKRLLAMKALTEKGVCAQELGIPLQNTVLEDGKTDTELMRLLLQNQAPVDVSQDPDKNPVLLLARKGDPSLLRTLLCRARPRPRKQTLAAAIPIAFAGVRGVGYEAALSMITMLLQWGAAGAPVDQALANAILTDSRLDIVRALLDQRADANHAGGLAYGRAIETGSFETLELICAKCPLREEGLAYSYRAVINPKHFKLETLEFLLASAPAPAVHKLVNGSSDVDQQMTDHPNVDEIMPCLIWHGLDVDKNGGQLLFNAIKSKETRLLRALLSGHPNNASLATGFRGATIVAHPSVKHEMWELLLEKAASAEIGQSASLSQEIQAAVDGDLSGLRLLLRHNANVDFNGGRAIQKAAAAGSLETLELLLLSGAGSLALDQAFLAASASPASPDKKHGIFTYLLKTKGGISAHAISEAFATCMESHPNDAQLARLLLSHNPSVEFKTIQVALTSSSSEVFKMLAEKVTDPALAEEAFQFVQHAGVSTEKEYKAYSCLLDKGIDKDKLSEAAFYSIKTHPDTSDTLNLLLDHGAQLDYKNGDALTEVIQSGNLTAVRLISQYLVDEAYADVANLAFNKVSDPMTLSTNVRFEMYLSLLKCSISKTTLYEALVRSLEGREENISAVRLLLAHGADPNQNEAHCFKTACGKDAEPEFRALSKHADLKVVLPLLIDSSEQESQSARWIRLCLEEQPRGTTILWDEFLFHCIRKFPKGTTVLNILLDHGVSASAKTSCSLRKRWTAEECTALIWALVATPKVSNKTIMCLLERGSKALPAYSAPRKRVSAAFLCLLDPTRTPVLENILDIASRDILNSTISGSTLRDLASKRNKSTQKLTALFEDDDEISLREAALFLGNLDAFRLLESGKNQDDGTLHLAALLALPDFIRWLLERHDASHESEAFDMMVPLALACFSKPFPWCKVANRKSEWADRLKETMELLLPKTKRNWRHRKRSVLHIALENGPEVTRAMVEALDTVHGPERDKTDTYTDKTGGQYSTREYVEEFVDVSEKEKMELLACLEEHGIS